MTAILNRAYRAVEDVTIDLIKANQPGFSFSYDIMDQVEQIASYAEESIMAMIRLADRDPDKLLLPTIQLGCVGVLGCIITAMFISIIPNLFLSMVCISHEYLLTVAINLLIACGAGFVSVQILKDVDARVRLEDIKYRMLNTSF